MIEYKLNAEAGSLSVTGGEATLSLRSPLPADHPFYAQIGRVASELAHLEHMLDLIIWDLIGGDQRLLACITSQIMGVGPRCKAIAGLAAAKHVDDALIKPIRKIMSDSYGLADRRNRVIHDPWYLEHSSDTPGQFRAMPYSDPRYGIQDISKEEIDGLLAEIDVMKARVDSFRSHLSDALEKPK